MNAVYSTAEAVRSIAETVKSAALALSTHSESPRLDAELLLGKVLGLSRASLIARDDQPVVPDDALRIE
jgi:PrmC N-terminal domain